MEAEQQRHLRNCKTAGMTIAYVLAAPRPGPPPEQRESGAADRQATGGNRPTELQLRLTF